MRMILIAYDHDFALGRVSGTINGGTVTLSHLNAAMKRLGIDCELVENDEHLPDADVYVIQSEWYGGHIDFFKKKREEGKKVVVWLGHWIGGVYYDPARIEADVFFTTWKGEVVNDFIKKTGKQVHYIPHAYGEDTGATKIAADVVFAGNTYPLRPEDVLYGVDVHRLYGIMPNELPAYYRGAKICLNIHAPFQTGEIATHASRVADISGISMNERVFQISGAGGFQLCQYHPMVKEIFGDNVPMFLDNEDLKNKLKYWMKHPQERNALSKKAQDIVLQNHTYTQRTKQIIDLIC
jgi:hypothetical protein